MSFKNGCGGCNPPYTKNKQTETKNNQNQNKTKQTTNKQTNQKKSKTKQNKTKQKTYFCYDPKLIFKRKSRIGHKKCNMQSGNKITTGNGNKLQTAPELCFNYSPLTSPIIVSPNIMYMRDFVLRLARWRSTCL